MQDLTPKLLTARPRGVPGRRKRKNRDRNLFFTATHRPVFANLSLTERRFLETGIGAPGVLRKDKAEPVYYNTGSCVHPRCITGIEITAAPSKDNKPVRPHFTLVKWGYIAGDEICAADGCRSYPLAITRTFLEDGQ